MAKIVVNDKEIEVADNTSFLDVIDELEKEGVSFACHQGLCGVCEINVVEGAENLTDITTEEDSYGMDGKKRLACQVSIKQGTVKITTD